MASPIDPSAGHSLQSIQQTRRAQSLRTLTAPTKPVTARPSHAARGAAFHSMMPGAIGKTKGIGQGATKLTDLLPQGGTPPKDPPAGPDPMKTLLAHWGRSDSEWDLDASGTVDVKDMLELLRRMAAGEPTPLDTPPPVAEPAPNGQPGATPAGEAQQTDPLQSLFDAWGTSNAQWDLDGSGTVDTRDMLQLLAQMAKGDAPPPSPQPEPHMAGGATNDGTTLPVDPQPLTDDPIQQLKDAWGQTDSKWDLDGSGRVDVKDFLQLLASMSGVQQPAPAPPQPDLLGTIDPTKVAEAPDAIADTEVPLTPQQRVDALLSEYGQSGSQWDLDGSGTVDVRDLLQLLRDLSQRPVMAGSSPTDGAPRIGLADRLAALSPQRFAYGRANADAVARSLLPHMNSSGPDQVRNAVDESSLPEKMKARVLDRLSQWHPRGHHVSYVG